MPIAPVTGTTTDEVALPRPEAVLLDRDGTLIEDVPYNGDPAKVRPMPTAAEAVRLLRERRIPTAIVSNQSGVARKLVTPWQVVAVTRETERQLGGRLGPWCLCFHAPEDGCECRKPAPGLVLRAAERLGVDPRACVVVGDTEADVRAGLEAGARAILVPNGVTLIHEVHRAPEVAPTLLDAVERVFAWRAAA